MNTFPLDADAHNLLLVKKVVADGNSNYDQVQSSSNQQSYQQGENQKVLRATPKPRSFSDIFTGSKLVLVKKNNVQNKSNLLASTVEPTEKAPISVTSSSSKPTTLSSRQSSTSTSSTSTTTVASITTLR